LQSPEPSSYAQANLYPEWEMFVNQELKALEKNGTRQLTSSLARKKAFTSN